MSDTKYSVTWDAYQKSICNGFSSLQQRGAFVDMTLAADGHHVKVHQMVMSLVSPYLSDLIASAACPHPVIFLNSVSYETLQCILQYAYTGEVVVSNDKIQEFFNICKELHIRGMEDCTNSLQPVSDSEQAPAPTHPAAPLHSHTIPKERDRNKLFKDPLDDETSPVKEEITVDDSLHMDDDTDYQSDNNVKPITTLCRTKIGSKTTAKPDAAMISYSVSNQGTPQIVLNRYIYGYHYSKNAGASVWRCASSRSRCCARVILDNGKVLKRIHAGGSVRALLSSTGRRGTGRRRTCRLAVPNSPREALHLKELLAAALGIYYEDGVWNTVHGQLLSEAGYAAWWPGWPRGFMESTGQLENYSLFIKTAFICEKAN